MKRLLPLTLLALAACATGADAPYSPVGAFEYGAMGHDPFWMVAIGDDQIVLTMGPPGGRADGELLSTSYPRVLPRETDGVRRWESGEGTQVIAIEARTAECTTGGRAYPDQVTVTLSGRMLKGCGGEEVVESRG
ncbi:hypothetical protein [Allosphingosinicella sp.]|uniref:hypothetical protein n=1 Tax=Allosphingosinicella sp. TaxID=2823234 RepID=UPI002FC19572